MVWEARWEGGQNSNSRHFVFDSQVPSVLSLYSLAQQGAQHGAHALDAAQKVRIMPHCAVQPESVRKVNKNKAERGSTLSITRTSNVRIEHEQGRAAQQPQVRHGTDRRRSSLQMPYRLAQPVRRACRLSAADKALERLLRLSGVTNNSLRAPEVQSIVTAAVLFSLPALDPRKAETKTCRRACRVLYSALGRVVRSAQNSVAGRKAQLRSANE